MTDPIEGIGGVEGTPEPPRISLGKQHAVIGLFLACLVVEAVLSGSDFGLWGTTRWRMTAFQNAGFWAGLLYDWRPNYALQPYAMFFTYGFLHAGLAHFAVNMLTLVSLGPPIVERIGQNRFAGLYFASIVGGAVGFALLSHEAAPMVGASGALFGLAGALLCWEFRDRFARSLSLKPVLRALVMLVGLNVVLWWAMHGQLAWQTHLGGFFAGAAAGWCLDRRPIPV